MGTGTAADAAAADAAAAVDAALAVGEVDAGVSCFAVIEDELILQRRYGRGVRVEVLGVPDDPGRELERGFTRLMQVRVVADGAVGYAFVGVWEMQGCAAWRQAVVGRTAYRVTRPGVFASADETLARGVDVRERSARDVDGDGRIDVVMHVAEGPDEREVPVVVALGGAAGFVAFDLGYNGGGSVERFAVALVTAGAATYFVRSDAYLCKADDDCESDAWSFDVVRFVGGRPLRVLTGVGDMLAVEPGDGEGLLVRRSRHAPPTRFRWNALGLEPVP